MAVKMTKRDFLEMFLGILFSVIISLLAVIVFAIIVNMLICRLRRLRSSTYF